MTTLRNRRPTWGAEGAEQEYWLSYSDLMAGLLMIFALMLFAALHHYGGIIQEAGGLANTRTEIIVKLDSILRADSSGITIDPMTGAVKFPDGVLFDQGSARLRPDGRAQLDRFAGQYFGVLLGDPAVKRALRAVVIEGHTNDDSSYMFNLELSQRRAFAVMQHLLRAAPLFEQELKEYVTANGRSFSQPILCAQGVQVEYPCPPGQVDKVRSRRIEILFRLRDDDLLERIRRMLMVT
jgi:chemotaxis protein MotB